MTSKVLEIYQTHEVICHVDITGITYNLKCFIQESIRPVNQYDRPFEVKQYYIINRNNGKFSKTFSNPSHSSQGKTVEEAIDIFLTRVEGIIPNLIDEV